MFPRTGLGLCSGRSVFDASFAELFLGKARMEMLLILSGCMSALSPSPCCYFFVELVAQLCESLKKETSVYADD